MQTIASDQRPSRFIAILSDGFRPFFLLGALYAALMIMLWVPWFLGIIKVPSQLSPVAWYAHELLFGLLAAIIAGILLTAIANWTSRPPVSGWLLAVLLSFWFAGRLAITLSRDVHEFVVAVICLLFPMALAITVAREDVRAGTNRNFKLAILVGGLAFVQASFYYEFWLTGRAKLSIAVTVSLVLILLMVIAGRMIPSFTSNWLKANRPGPLPKPFGAFDLASNAISVTALAGWVSIKLLPDASTITNPVGILIIAAAVTNVLRQMRWQPLRTFAEPMVCILHVAYLFISIGFTLLGASILMNHPGLEMAGLHAWTAGAFLSLIHI